MVKLRTQAQRKGMLNAQNYAQVSGSNLMLKFKVSTMGLSSEIKVEAKRKIPLIKLFTTLHRTQLNTTLNSLAKILCSNPMHKVQAHQSNLTTNVKIQFQDLCSCCKMKSQTAG